MIKTTDKNIISRLQKMDNISKSFCGAKWYEGTIWLYAGATASCHHNPYHDIDPITGNPSSIFNTAQKEDERRAMLNGERRPECNTCWKVENAGGVSDRIYKTEFISSLAEWSENKATIPLNIIPNNIELAFSRVCNLACMYCIPAFSSTWEADIKNNGAYGLKTEQRHNLSYHGVPAEQTDKILSLFWKWWPELEKSLIMLKITGGEPLMSSEFWELLDKVHTSTVFKGTVTINTNLVQPKEKIDKLVQLSSKKNIVIATSIESSLDDAEYSRDGFDKEIWLENVNTLLSSGIRITMSTTINNVTVWSFAEYIKMIIDLKKKYGLSMVQMNCNVIHRPIYFQLQLIPKHLRLQLSADIESFLMSDELLTHEKEHIRRFILYLTNNEFMENENGCTLEEAIDDLKHYISEFDKRRNKNFRTLNSQFVNWITE
jgi:MoaA/NifB/PqqE/SkfB family radical SAM enzyme